MSEEKKKRRYKAKPRGWSKSGDEEKIDKSKKENKTQENNMDEKEVQALMDERDQKLLDIFSKKFGGDTPPGGDKMDQDTKDYLDKIGKSVEKQGKILEGLFGERERKENEDRVRQIIKDALKPVLGEQKLIRGMICDDEGNCRLPTKEEVASLKIEQDKRLEKIEKEAKKTPEGKPDLSQLSGQDLWDQIKKSETYVLGSKIKN